MSDWSQNKYNVSFSPIALLNEIQKTEIDAEVLSIFYAIESGSSFNNAS